MWVFSAIAVCAIGIVVWWRWATASSRLVLGETDYTPTIREFIRCVKDGSRLVLETSDRTPRVSLTRRSAENGEPTLEVRLLGDQVSRNQIDELHRNLELLCIPFTVEGFERTESSEKAVFRLSTGCVDDSGRVVDLSLAAAGVSTGESYSHRFEGEFDAEADLEYIRGKSLAARDLADGRLQRSLFDWILKHLK